MGLGFWKTTAMFLVMGGGLALATLLFVSTFALWTTVGPLVLLFPILSIVVLAGSCTALDAISDY